MKLEHLVQGYQFNKIPIKIEKQIKENEEKAGVIKFNDNIHASYLLDGEDIVIAFSIFCNCVVRDNKILDNQLKHTIDIINIIQKSIELIGNTRQEEANEILKKLGMFKGKIETKAVNFLNYTYKIEVIAGLLMFSIIENETEE